MSIISIHVHEELNVIIHARIQEFSSGGVQVSMTKKSSKSHFSRFQRGPTFSRGVQLFSGGGGGGGGVHNITCDFPGGVQTPCPPSGSALD